jgi:C2 domain-containing protein
MTERMTKTMLLALLGMVAAGCHAAPCGGCAEWETCEAATNACALNAGTMFDLVADDGSVPGDNWDPFFGPPDPYICASVGGAEKCTEVDSDDATPSWDEELLADLSGDGLLSTPIAIRYEDSDIDGDDPICSGTVVVTASELHVGGFTFNCSNGSYARFTLHNSERGTPTVAP